MAKRMTLEEATQRIIDRISLVENAEAESIDKYMRQYASIKELEEAEYEKVYRTISEALFGSQTTEVPAEEPGEVEEVASEEATALEVVQPAEVVAVPAMDEGATFVTVDDVLRAFGKVLDIIRARGPEVAIKAGLGVLDILSLLSFWVPELVHRAVFWLVWVVGLDAVVLVKKVVPRARMAAMAAGRTFTVACAELRSLWRMREELISEYKVA